MQGQLIPPKTQVGTDAYAEFVGMFISTIGGGYSTLGYRIAAATQGLTFKAQGSIDGANWEDITARAKTDSPQAGAEVGVAAAGSDYLFVLPVMGTLSAYPFYRLMVKNTTPASVGTGTAAAFAK